MPISAISVSNGKYVAKQTNKWTNKNQNKKKGDMKTYRNQVLNSAKPNANCASSQMYRTDEFKNRKCTNDSRYALDETCPALVMRRAGCSCL